MGIKLRTDWALEPGDKPLDHHSKILLIGSCFSEHMARKLRFSGFDLIENPHGILFHPLALERAVTDCAEKTRYKKEDLVFNGETWTSLNHHGRFNHPDPEVVLNSIHSEISDANSYLPLASHLVLTLGTSWVYRHRKRDCYVANCHKIPQGEFEKLLLSPQEIRMSLERIVSKVHEVNPSIAIILTVSPVRHIKDGLVENTLSKARLHEAVQQLVAANECMSYFPAYELMMDDLRDYRFYETDLIHPNEVAIEYIWEKFRESWVDVSARELIKEAESIHRALQHRPLQTDSGKLEVFRDKIEKQIQRLQEAHPEVRIYRR